MTQTSKRKQKKIVKTKTPPKGEKVKKKHDKTVPPNYNHSFRGVSGSSLVKNIFVKKIELNGNDFELFNFFDTSFIVIFM